MNVPSVAVDTHHRYSPEIRDQIIAKLRATMAAVEGETYRLLSPAHLRGLAAVSSPKSPVLSLYLQLTPGRRVGNVWRTVFSGLAEPTLRRIDDRSRRREVREEFDRIESALHEELPALGKGTAFFACRSIGLWRRVAVPVPLPDGVHLGDRPYIRPLVRTRDEHERFVLGLLSLEHSRFFVSQIGQVEEVFRVEGQGPREILADRTATDRRDAIIAEAVKNEAKVLAQVAESALAEFESRHLLLSSAPELHSTVLQYLPKDVSGKFGGEFSVELHAGLRAVAEAAEPAQRSVEEREEVAAVERLREAGPARSTWGEERTLEALRQGRVMLLAVDDMFAAVGAQCLGCGSLWESQSPRCPDCGGKMVEVDDLVELALEQALAQRAAIEIVRSARARELMVERGRMAGLLR